MKLGIGVGLWRYHNGNIRFTPASLFDGGQQGHWSGGYDPASGRMWQDSTGVTPVTAAEQPVGLVLDKSQGVVMGPELVTNGGFETADGWTLGDGWTISGGKLRSDGSQANNTNCFIPASVFPGKTYEVRFTVADRNSGSVRVFNGGSGSITSFKTENREYVERLITNSVVESVFVQQTSNFDGTIDNVSVRELPGNHATQPTALSRPTLARWPKGGRRNLLTWTEDFSKWTLSNGSGGSSLDGNRVTFGVGSFADRIGSISTAVSAVAHTGSAVLSGSGVVRLFASDGAGAVGAPTTITLTPDPTRYVVSRLFGSSGGGGQIRIYGDASGTPSVVYIGDPQLEVGSTATPYQRVTTDFDVTEAGVPDVWHLYDDGGDSLPATFPAGNLHLAYVNELGEVSYTTDTSDGTTGVDLLLAERMADVIVLDRAFTSDEEAKIESYWARYAA